MRTSFRVAAFAALVFMALPITSAQAQWGYPGGYGGYGWGGWGGGGTPQGDYARGMGAYAAGAGYYNEQTAVARSINADTVMRFNQYVYESQMEANRLHHEKLAKERLNNIQQRAEIAKRLRDNPEPRDVFSGDALNVAFDEVSNPKVNLRYLQGTKTKIGGETIRQIPFQAATAAITVSIHQLAQTPPPAQLMTKDFEENRQAIKGYGQEIRRQIEAGNNPDAATIDKMLVAIESAKSKADSIYKPNTRDRIEVDKYLKGLHGLIAMLKTPALELILAGVEKRPDATLGELINFMNSFNLRFGSASTPEQRMIYQSLYQKLVDLRNEAAPALASGALPKSSGGEAGEFFSGMSYEDLHKKAPAPTPAPPQPNP